MLDKQINIYSVDTGNFYSNNEKRLHGLNCKYRQERNYLKNKLDMILKELAKFNITKNAIDKYVKDESSDDFVIDENCKLLVDDYMTICNLIAYKRRKANESKQKLLQLLKNKIEHNISTNGLDHIRVLNENSLNDNNIISIFESNLSRTIGIKQDDLSEDLMVLQVYYFDVFKDLMLFGYIYKGERYIYYTSSAGQIRKKKAVFIKEKEWLKHEKTLMCGLTIDEINKKGGNNVNKHLAYLALNNSATDEWSNFNIDRCIVVDDFETNVSGIFDYINDKTYEVKRMTNSVPIAHMDGAGVMLPSVSKKNFMIRLPFVKGLLCVFDYLSLIKEKGWSPVITDIYGVEHDVVQEEIEIILTKSQFKLWKYYDSWQQYKDYFRKYNCAAGICRSEEDIVPDATINYQMLQTLTDITDKEIDTILAKSVEKVSNVCTSIDTMKNILGITPYNTNMTPFQKSVDIYPALLKDTYSKDVLRDVKNSLVKRYRSGKIEIKSKYTFIIPDLYAFCEWLFGRIECPDGLLNDGEVYCKLFRKYDKLDCLRSPHLYKEHAVRVNMACKENCDIERYNEFEKWYITDGLYASTKDLISRILQYDVDGDTSLVVADKEFIKIAERNMDNIVPLYYEMKKAQPTLITPETIYNGLNSAFVGGNIGIYSNDISKIWNSGVFKTGSNEEKAEALKVIQLLCAENNFVIDYAKTLYKPTRPSEIDELVKKYTQKKLPAFFQYAKDKDKSQTEQPNDSFVNKIYFKIPDKPIRTNGIEFGKLDYKKMMNNVNITCSKEVMELYDKLNRQYHYMVNMKDEYVDNLRYISCSVRNQFNDLGYTDETISDMLVQYLYGKNKRSKHLLWFCYGQYIYNNLERHIEIKKKKIVQCEECGEWFETIRCRSYKCDNCKSDYRREYLKKYSKKHIKL